MSNQKKLLEEIVRMNAKALAGRDIERSQGELRKKMYQSGTFDIVAKIH